MVLPDAALPARDRDDRHVLRAVRHEPSPWAWATLANVQRKSLRTLPGFLLARGLISSYTLCCRFSAPSRPDGRGRRHGVPERSRIRGPAATRRWSRPGAPSADIPSAARAPVAIAGSPGSPGAPPRQLFVPDLIAAVPGGITSAQVAKISKLGGVPAVLPVDGGQVTVNGQSADVLGVSPQAFRAWTPLATAASAAVWSDLGQGELISTGAAARKLHLVAGKSYQVSGAAVEQVPFGGADRAQRPRRGRGRQPGQVRAARAGEELRRPDQRARGQPDHADGAGPVGRRPARPGGQPGVVLAGHGGQPAGGRRTPAGAPAN